MTRWAPRGTARGSGGGDHTATAGDHRHPGTGPHSARHTHGTRSYAATRDLRLVQDELGHADPSTTAIYAHVATERKLAAADAAFAIDGDE